MKRIGLLALFLVTLLVCVLEVSDRKPRYDPLPRSEKEIPVAGNHQGG
jgi:hypothetical protein